MHTQPTNVSQLFNQKEIHVLLVEDDPVQAAVISATLEQDGCVITHCDSAYEALEAIDNTHVDVVLTDYYLPGMNGLALVNELQLHLIDLPIVFMTAQPDLNMAFHAATDGVMDVIVKDKSNDYLKVITHVLRRSIDQYINMRAATELEKQIMAERELAFNALNRIDQPILIVTENQAIDYLNESLAELLASQENFNFNKIGLDSVVTILNTLSTFYYAGMQTELSKVLLTTKNNDKERLLVFKQTSQSYKLKTYSIDAHRVAVTLLNITKQQNRIRQFEALVEQMPVAMLITEVGGQLILANRQARKLLAMENIQSMDIQSLLSSSIIDQLFFEQANTKSSLNNGKPVSYQSAVMRRGDQDDIMVDLQATKVSFSDLQFLVFNFSDVSYRARAEADQVTSDKLLSHAVQHAPFCMLFLDVEGIVRAASYATENLLWYKTGQIQGRNVATLFSPSEVKRYAIGSLIDSNTEFLSIFNSFASKLNNQASFSCELELVRADQSTLFTYASLAKQYGDDGLLLGYVFSAHDYTEQKRAIAYINHIAKHDELTGLPNRSTLQDRIDLAIKRVKRFGKKLAILHIDIDSFKRINDSVGHRLGDAVVKEVANRIKGSIRDTDSVSRTGGDEFVVLLTDLDSLSSVETLVRDMQSKISKSLHLNRLSLHLTTTIGVVMCPDHGMAVDELLRKSDLALFSAKDRCRGKYLIYDTEKNQDLSDTLWMEQGLYDALKKEQFEVYYQPKVDTKTGKLSGFEALIRWRHPEHGFISPEKFIPVAESIDIIHDIGLWVFKTAAQDIAGINETSNDAFTVSINVSPRQLEDLRFVKELEIFLKNSHINADNLEVEITESLLVKDSETALKNLENINRLGIKIAIDDFGVGYSSLAYLSQYPIKVIKIDRAFMDIRNEANVAIIGAICGISRGLGLSVVAEGVETEDQLALVARHGCDLVQGYFYSKPLPLEDLLTYIAQRNSHGQVIV